MLPSMIPRSLNPFAKLSNGREVWAWGMYDLANQSFQLLVNTLLFGIFLAKVVLKDSGNSKTVFGTMVAAALVVVVVLSPGLGAWADARGLRKRLLVATGLGAVVLTAGLCVLGPGMTLLAGALYIGAAVLVGLGENFLGSFLPFLSTPQTVGKISALGWTMSYIGAILLLGLTALCVFVLDLRDPAQWRWLFGLAALWFALGMLPSMFILREPPAEGAAATSGGFGSLFIDSVRRLRQTLREAVRFRQLMRFLGVFFVYSLGTNTVVYFLGQIGDDFGFEIGKLTLMALVMAVAAGVGAVLAGRYQDKLGHRRTIAVFLVMWVLSTLVMACSARFHFSQDWFWPIAGGLGIALGGIGTSSRAAVGAFTPPGKSGEFFGLWGMTYKLSGVIGLLAFAWANKHLGQAPSLFLLASFFAAGLALLPLVDEREGVRNAAAASPPA
jgi:UMF1 family MFS transporter